MTDKRKEPFCMNDKVVIEIIDTKQRVSRFFETIVSQTEKIWFWPQF